MSSDVWVGALLSIPIGIATGLAVTPIQRWMEDRGKTRAVAQIQRIQKDYNMALFYQLHPHHFTQYMLHTVIKTTFVAAAVGIIVEIIFVGRSFIAIPILDQLGEMTAIVSSVLIIQYCRPALKLWHQVRNFEEYVKDVPASIRDRSAEERAEKREQGLPSA